MFNTNYGVFSFYKVIETCYSCILDSNVPWIYKPEDKKQL